MPSYIVKAEPTDDFYVVWSTVVDAPTCWGSRADLAECHHDPRELAPERFERADTNGTSANWPNWPTADQPYSWGDDGFGLGECGPPYGEDGWWSLPRANLRAFCERGAGEDTADLCVFEAFHEASPLPPTAAHEPSGGAA